MYEYKNTDTWKEKLYQPADLLTNILDNNSLNDIDLHVLLELQLFFSGYAEIKSHSELKELLIKLFNQLHFQSGLIK